MPHQRNAEIAERLRLMAALREAQGDNGYRVQAYSRAADVVENLPSPLEHIVATSGREGLVALPAIGEGIASAIVEMINTGGWAEFDRLSGQLTPESLFQSIPGIGPKLAERLHDALDVDTLEALEIAAHDGRLERVAGVGVRRASAIRQALGARLGRRPASARGGDTQPSVSVLLDIDEAYRRKAAAGALRMIAPRRFNPDGAAWLPVMHEDRGPWRFTALFSNTARAHARKRTGDWVVLYFHSDHDPERQCTIVTEMRGRLEGKRVVRGREDECAAHYRALARRPVDEEG